MIQGITDSNQKIVSDGLKLNLDAAQRRSYPTTGTTWTDLSGNAYNGTLAGSSPPTYNSLNGGSISFSGGSFNVRYISEYSIPASFWNAGSWTASVWVKFNIVGSPPNQDNSIIGHGVVATTSNMLHLGERARKVQFGMYGNDLTGLTTLSAGVFYNIVWTYNSSSFLKQIYVNSIFDTSVTGTAYTGTGTGTRLGSYSITNFGALNLNGNLYTVQLYNKVLSAAEVSQNYNATKSRFGL